MTQILTMIAIYSLFRLVKFLIEEGDPIFSSHTLRCWFYKMPGQRHPLIFRFRGCFSYRSYLEPLYVYRSSMRLIYIDRWMND